MTTSPPKHPGPWKEIRGEDCQARRKRRLEYLSDMERWIRWTEGKRG